MKTRHTPIRTCVACRATDEKRDLLRVVRQPDGSVRYDPKGKLSGRGAYVCANAGCIAQARKQKKLERSLKVSLVPEDLFGELSARATTQDAGGTGEPLDSPPAMQDGATPPATQERGGSETGSDSVPQKSEVESE